MLFFLLPVLSGSLLPLCDDPLLYSQPRHAHEVHDTPQVSKTQQREVNKDVKA